ncbi:hypothetical protein B9Z55_028593 [Caenorhabditis nigoni]|uniref:F-box domain-containing protein n=2 Tax=Caenorhabditis nigoni TaxID=1611254 RepID=A0A2G5SB28_9PELO|nr:hypothetical protein B9Z55_028593 [Caenorhabditis nigoni]
MSIPLTRFPVLVQEKILDFMDFYDLYSFSETSKRSRSLSKRSAKRHEGHMKVSLHRCLKLKYKSSSHPNCNLKINLEDKGSTFENLEKYLSIRHSSLFVNVTISLKICHWLFDFDFTLITFDHLAQLGYPLKKCYVEGFKNNEAIVRALITFRKAERVDMSIEPTTDFEKFDFVTPFTESLENESLQILYPDWVSPWHVNNVFNKCREVTLSDRMFSFAESDVIEILKSWRTESSIRTLILTFDLAGSIEDFGAKMVEMKAKPVQEAASSMEMKRQRRWGYVSSAWLLKQINTGAEVLVTVGNYPHEGTRKDLHMKEEFELEPENR